MHEIWSIDSQENCKKIVATSCQILRLRCTTFDFGYGSAPDPAGGAYSDPQLTLAGFKGAYFYGSRGKRWVRGGRGGREGERKGGRKGGR